VQFFEQNLCLNVAVKKSCLSIHPRAKYLAGTDEQRADDINAAFSDNKIKALFFIRGGYGMQRVLPLLDYNLLRRNPKIIAGYSDITALHTVLNQLCGFVTYHAPMAATELCRSNNDYTLRSFTNNLFSNGTTYLKNPDGMALHTVFPGKASGLLTGGNLSVVVSSIGTPFEIDTRDKILFLEDIQESPYRIDRMMLQLKYARKFRDCSGLLLGSFSPENLDSLEAVIHDILLPEKKPLLAGLACGHCLPTMTLPMGANVYMDSNRKIVRFLRGNT
jgi:muramoyltetrapeptide carboxypeptidase